jgi:hypothetical protein
MKTQVIIPVHSFIDIITNSSSEVYVTSDRKTVEAVKNVIDALLLIGGSKETCDNLFEVVLERVEGGYGEYNAIRVIAKDPNCRNAAVLINKLNDAFNAETIGND